MFHPLSSPHKRKNNNLSNCNSNLQSILQSNKVVECNCFCNITVAPLHQQQQHLRQHHQEQLAAAVACSRQQQQHSPQQPNNPSIQQPNITLSCPSTSPISTSASSSSNIHLRGLINRNSNLNTLPLPLTSPSTSSTTTTSNRRGILNLSNNSGNNNNNNSVCGSPASSPSSSANNNRTISSLLQQNNRSTQQIQQYQHNHHQPQPIHNNNQQNQNNNQQQNPMCLVLLVKCPNSKEYCTAPNFCDTRYIFSAIDLLKIGIVLTFASSYNNYEYKPFLSTKYKLKSCSQCPLICCHWLHFQYKTKSKRTSLCTSSY